MLNSMNKISEFKLRPLDPKDHLLYKIGHITYDDLTEQFKREVNDRASEVDPSNEQDWFSILLGWAIAKGLSSEDAHRFASYVRYNTDLG